MTVRLDKKYRTAKGHKVRLLCLDFNNADGSNTHKVLGLITSLETCEEWVAYWTQEGHNISHEELNLIEVPSWDGLADDEPVLYTAIDSLTIPLRGHFAGSFNGIPHVYKKGMSKWSSDGIVEPVFTCTASISLTLDVGLPVGQQRW